MGAGIAKYAKRFISRLPRVTLFKISPHINESMAHSINEIDKSSVGTLGTKPVCINSIKMGVKSKIETTANMVEVKPKKEKGFSEIKSLMMVDIILMPSIYVDNLLTEPSWRAP